jgi:hypothetical protein
MKKRKIDQRFKPPVKGIDLFQSMNYIALKDVSVDFIYGNYSSSTICHVPGSRPVLEKLARSLRIRPHNAYRQTAALAKYVAEEVLWAGFYERKTGHKLAPDRNMTEEQILRSGYGWCNEQARLFSALTQICGIPSRLVFASNHQCTFGHVVVEVLLPAGWMLVDQSFGYCFTCKGRPVSAWEVTHVPRMARHFGPIYNFLCRDLEQQLGPDILNRDFRMSMVRNPLVGFQALGYHNHFV